ncbi:MAG: L,D-transpeptidase [Pseudolabrys sp.]
MRFGRVLASVAAAVVVAFAASGPALASLLITIDKSTQRMEVALDGLPVFDWPVSTGKLGYDTPSGEFKPFRMERHHFSREWDDAPMPHSVFFTKRGHAIHGTNQLKAIGRPASHGCVRLAPENAELLFKLVKQEGLANTRVVLRGETPAAPGIAGAPDGNGDDFTAALPPRADRNGPAFFDGQNYYDRRGRRYSGPVYREPPRYYYDRDPPRYYRAPPRYYRDREYYVDQGAPPFWWGR